MSSTWVLLDIRQENHAFVIILRSHDKYMTAKESRIVQLVTTHPINNLNYIAGPSLCPPKGTSCVYTS